MLRMQSFQRNLKNVNSHLSLPCYNDVIMISPPTQNLAQMLVFVSLLHTSNSQLPITPTLYLVSSLLLPKGTAGTSWGVRAPNFVPSCYTTSVVGIATGYGLERSGIESRWGRDFPPVQTGPGAHPASCTMGTGSFPGVKCGRGVLLTTHPILVPRSRKSRAILLPTL